MRKAGRRNREGRGKRVGRSDRHGNPRTSRAQTSHAGQRGAARGRDGTMPRRHGPNEGPAAMTIKRILVATDGSPDAERAIDWLEEFPLPADAAVDVVSAVQAPFAADAAVALGWSEFVAENERVVAEARRRLEKRWSAVTGRVVDGDPRRAIVEAARRAGSDLIVLGARGLGTVASFLLGSVSLGVTRHAPCPVLVFREPARPVRTVTIAIDSSADARVAFEFFADLPLPPDLRVRLVGVVVPLGYPTSVPGFMGSTLRSVAQDFENEARRSLEAELRPLAARLRPRVRSVVI